VRQRQPTEDITRAVTEKDHVQAAHTSKHPPHLQAHPPHVQAPSTRASTLHTYTCTQGALTRVGPDFGARARRLKTLGAAHSAPDPGTAAAKHRRRTAGPRWIPAIQITGIVMGVGGGGGRGRGGGGVNVGGGGGGGRRREGGGEAKDLRACRTFLNLAAGVGEAGEGHQAFGARLQLG
jgi:hypothetical protein